MNKINQQNSKIQILFRILSLVIVVALFYGSVEQGRARADSTSGRSLVLLYADPENDSGLHFQDTQDGQSGQGNDDFATLRANLADYINDNPDIVVRLMVDSTNGSKVYTLSSDSEEQVEDRIEDGGAFNNLTTFLTQSITAFADSDAAFFAVVDYDNEWLQNVRPVINEFGQPCIANPANWDDDGRPDHSDDGGRPLPGGSSSGIGHNSLEKALCDVQSDTDQKLGVMPLETVLGFLAARDEIGTCSSLDSLLPHITIKPQYINVSSTSGGTVAGIPFQNRDILRYDMTNNLWSMLFDASDVGINKGNLVGFHIMGDGSILLSLSRPLSIPGFGRIDDSDIVRFVPTQLGFDTAGHFERYFDGSDVQLTRGSEDIDAISMLPDGRLLISTIGNVSVRGVRRGRDEDVLLFEPTSLGTDTQGQWSLYLDGSRVGLRTRNENIVGIDFDPSLPEREALHLATRGNFVVPMLRGANPDILSYAPDGDDQCTFEMSQRWRDFKGYFASEKLDGISYQIGYSGGTVVAANNNQMALGNSEQSLLPSDTSEGYRLYLPIVSGE